MHAPKNVGDGLRVALERVDTILALTDRVEHSARQGHRALTREAKADIVFIVTKLKEQLKELFDNAA